MCRPKSILVLILLSSMILVWPSELLSKPDEYILRIGLPRITNLTDPAASGSAINSANLAILHRSLTKIAAGGLLKGDLAKSWSFDKDHKEFRFCLERARFGSGRVLTLEDIKYSFSRVIKYRKYSGLSRIVLDIDPTITYDGDAVNLRDLCIRISLKKPFPDFLYMIANPVFSIVPNNGNEDLLDGLGPYRSIPYRDSKGKLFVDFHRKDEITQIGPRIIKFIPVGNIDNAIKMLASQEIDVFFGLLDFQNVPRNGASYTVEKLETLAISHLAFNLNKPFLADKRLRSDILAFIQSLAEKYAEKDGIFQFNPHILPRQILPSNASRHQNQVLSKEEFSRKWKRVLGGRRFRIVGWANEMSDDLVKEVEEYLGAAGAKVEYMYGYLDVAPKLEANGDYEMIFTSQLPEFEKPESFFEIFHYEAFKGKRFARVLDKYKDDIKRIRSIVDGRERRMRYLELFESIEEENIIVPLYTTRIPLLVSSKVKLPESKFRYFVDVSMIQKL